MKIAFIGTGNVGAPLADRLQKLGHDVAIAARDPQSQSVQAVIQRNPALVVKTPLEAVQSAEIIFLATPFNAIEAALTPIKYALEGKILVDCTNPVGAGLSHGLQSQTSGSETVQELIPETNVVKAFTIYGFENFEDSTYAGYGDLKPAMLIAGNEQSAKATVMELCSQLGWEPIDTGSLGMSLHLEHMTLLWIKMARVQGWGAGMVWAMLKR
ncbi:MAG: NADPH-dependent F420 reductase [Pseudanabaenaceae cyanobacterium bins.39]|nr:NADPH-dependent F420 reductase [Pseudanabaenaceae cyanobacterium bins.39]